MKDELMQDDDSEVLDQTPEEEVVEAPEVEQEQDESQDDGAEGSEDATEADEVVVTIGDEEPEEEPAERAPEWVRDLRKRNQETVKENRELRKQLEALKAAPVERPAVIGEKPTLESCEYDTDKFEQELTQWHEAKRQVAEQERKKQEEGAKLQSEWQAKVDAYEKGKASLKVKDVAEAEADAFEFLSVTQRGVVLDATDNPALVVYAIGKNPKKAQELAAITNPIKFAVAIHDLEKSMKVTPRKTAPLPETPVRGNARVSAGVDSTLERLRADADRTGDRTKVAAYMRQLQAKKRA